MKHLRRDEQRRDVDRPRRRVTVADGLTARVRGAVTRVLDQSPGRTVAGGKGELAAPLLDAGGKGELAAPLLDASAEDGASDPSPLVGGAEDGPSDPPPLVGGAEEQAVESADEDAAVAPVAPLRRPRYSRAPVLAVANQKGGVGKTTTAVSLAAALAETGAQILLVDFDPQGNASSGIGMRPAEDDATVYDVLIDEATIADVVRATDVRNLYLVPANIDLAGAEIELVPAFSREQRLRRALEDLRADYDVIIVDCPPSLGLLTVNALTAADGVIVPIQCEYYALEGLGALRKNVELVRANLNPSLELAGFVLTMLDGRTRLSQQVVEEVRTHFGERVFSTRIPRSVRLAEAPGFGQPITRFDPGSRGAMAYRRLAAELLERLDRSGTGTHGKQGGSP